MKYSIVGLVLLVATPTLANGETVASNVFAAASPSIVVVDAVGNGGTAVAQGSGVVIAKGVVVSNCHVFENRRAQTASVVYRGTSYPATLRYADLERDLCSFAVSGLGAPPATMRSHTPINVGEDTYAIGAPEGFELTLSDGIVSGLRHVPGGTVIQTTAPISPGSSGGGLFDSAGRLIGVTSYYEKEGQQINFALPVAWIIDLPTRGQTLDQLTSTEDEVSRDYERGVKAATNGDYHTAFAAFLPLAERGDVRAEVQVGLLYANGFGVAQSRTSALQWMHEAASQGNGYAQWWIGVSYSTGNGLPRNEAQAVLWYERSLASGYHGARSSLAFAYAYGSGVTRDYARAAGMFRTDAEQGGIENAVAQYSLAALYASGLGVPKDSVEAAMWIMITEAEGLIGGGSSLSVLDPSRPADSETPTEALAAIERSMTNAQISAAQDRAHAWLAAYKLRARAPSSANETRPGQQAHARPSDPRDVRAWQQFLTAVVQRNMGGISTTPFLYFVPSAGGAADVNALAKVQSNLNDVVVATVLPGNMVAIGGPSSATTAGVLEAAFRRAKPGSFKGVVILFIGNDADRAAVARALLQSGATFKFAQM